MNADEIIERLKSLGDAEQAKVLQRFFKTGKGEYGEGDIFIGLKVPETRKLAACYRMLELEETIRLLKSPIHEARLLALFILINDYRKSDAGKKERIYDLYLQNARHINNWDLVDSSAEHIVGAYLLMRDRAPLYKLAASGLLWERRISIMATFHFIKKGEFAETLKLSEIFLQDREDLMHKAVGWMLREIGKRDPTAEEGFLKLHYRKMPRTMLRYAIEKFPEVLRLKYLKGDI